MAVRRSIFFLLAALLLVGCDAGLSSTAGASITPAPTLTSAHRDKTTIQYCVDDTGSYPRDDFHGANQLIAQSLVDAVTPNSDGVTLYATLINSKTGDSSSTLDPFQIPSIAAYPSLPVPIPTPTEGNPISYAKEKQAAQAKNDDAIKAYNDQLANLKKQVEDLKKQVGSDANRLVNLNPAIDRDATSVWGCLQLARTRFAQNPGTHYLVIASDMENNTSVDYTADFQSSQALKDVHVAVVYFYCSNARSCQSTTAQWQNIFTSSGATSVKFSDPAQSKTLTNLFGGGA
ncbi:MAG TPA: hypothetical protein VHR15_02610 [Ktedonobacterales bacterium]|jgi:hypothetical protein|nr:hypothetical protein [Ktedonobacterales bacterium]